MRNMTGSAEDTANLRDVQTTFLFFTAHALNFLRWGLNPFSDFISWPINVILSGGRGNREEEF